MRPPIYSLGVLAASVVACQSPSVGVTPEPPDSSQPIPSGPGPVPTLNPPMIDVPEPVARDAFAAVRALGPPEGLFVPSLTYTDEAVDEAVAGTAVLLGNPIYLQVPFDWEQDPFDDRVYRLGLQAWWGLAPLLAGHASGQNRDGLALAIALAVDWIETYRTPFEGMSEFAFNSSAISFRAAYLAYIFRAGVQDGILSEDDAAVLWEGMVRHGDLLEEGSKLRTDSNLGVTHDVGLGLLGIQMPLLPRADVYRTTAAVRIRPLAETLFGEEVMLREHTPWYHFLVLRDLERARRFAPQLQDLFDRGLEGGMWLVANDGDLIQFGDSHRVPPQPDVVAGAALPTGLKTFEKTGFGVAREREGLLAVTAQFHSRIHKQRDEGTFAWFERGVRIVSDTGRYGYFPSEPGRGYAVSTRAHSVLTVDDFDFGISEEEIYGSGLVGGAESSGWYVLVADNPLLLAEEVSHRRYWVYRPNEALVIVDDVASARPRVFKRYLHLGQDLTTRREGEGLLAEGAGVSVAIHDASATRGTIAVTRGQENPSLLGFTYPTNRVGIPRDTVLMQQTLDSGLLVVTMGLDGELMASAQRAGNGIDVNIDGVNLRVRVEADVTLTVE